VTSERELRISSSCRIDKSELHWRTSRSGGPGGQHANTSDTKVEVSFNAADSPSLGPRQRMRIVTKLGPIVRAHAADSRYKLTPHGDLLGHREPQKNPVLMKNANTAAKRLSGGGPTPRTNNGLDQ
jgi:hypothetical protein